MKFKEILYVSLFFVASFCTASPLNNEYVHKLTQNGAMSCLANAVFYEANAESDTGKRMVALAILNRAVRYNRSICSIIKQPYQFSFYKAGFNWNTRATHKESVEIVVDVLRKSMLGLQTSYGGITHFHALSVRPAFASSSKFKLYRREGGHLFYVERRFD